MLFKCFTLSPGDQARRARGREEKQGAHSVVEVVANTGQ